MVSYNQIIDEISGVIHDRIKVDFEIFSAFSARGTQQSVNRFSDSDYNVIVNILADPRFISFHISAENAEKELIVTSENIQSIRFSKENYCLFYQPLSRTDFTDKISKFLKIDISRIYTEMSNLVDIELLELKSKYVKKSIFLTRLIKFIYLAIFLCVVATLLATSYKLLIFLACVFFWVSGIVSTRFLKMNQYKLYKLDDIKPDGFSVERRVYDRYRFDVYQSFKDLNSQ